ncbi:MAG: sigma 54-interacting transcriptional regulator [Xanthobacteraceae bacterium]|nr:sigma 54-interacting transcriptional regulator [Xanthobacteraceae bacterium]
MKRTEPKKEAANRESERFFRDVARDNRLILEAAGEGIYGVNAEGKTSFVNPAAARMLGWSAEELVGKDMHTTVHHSHSDGSHYHNHDCPIYAAFRDGAVHQVADEVFWRKDGSFFFVEYTSTPIRDRGVVVGAVIVFRDISQRREADVKLRDALSEVGRLREKLERENAYLQEEIRIEGNRRGIIGKSPAMQQILRQIEIAASSRSNVLIAGEVGTGKELIARAIHETSLRGEQPFIRVNCTTLSRAESESELFGDPAQNRAGRIELAEGGTLYLEEAGDLPPRAQERLLQSLEQGEQHSAEHTSRNIRIITASSRDLKAAARRGSFLSELFYRLNVIPIEAPSLRERRDDISLLAAHFLGGVNRKLRVSSALRISDADMRRLSQYDWPGNARELQNVIERGAILARGGQIRIDLPEPQIAYRTANAAAEVVTEDTRRDRDRANIVAALDACGGKIFGHGGAAELLGIKPTTLASRVKSLGIRYRRSAAREQRPH